MVGPLPALNFSRSPFMARVMSAYAVVSIHRVDQGIPGRGLTAHQNKRFPECINVSSPNTGMGSYFILISCVPPLG
jgi:hypothetical protein